MHSLPETVLDWHLCLHRAICCMLHGETENSDGVMRSGSIRIKIRVGIIQHRIQVRLCSVLKWGNLCSARVISPPSCGQRHDLKWPVVPKLIYVLMCAEVIVPNFVLNWLFNWCFTHIQNSVGHQRDGFTGFQGFNIYRLESHQLTFRGIIGFPHF